MNSEYVQIASECAKVGIKIESPWDLVGKRIDLVHGELASILAHHLHKEYSQKAKEGIIYALRTPRARPYAFDKLVDIVRNDQSDWIRQAAANALAVMLNLTDGDLIANMLRDRSIGRARALLIEPFRKLFPATSLDIIRKLIDDECLEVANEAIRTLGRMVDIKSKHQLEKITNDNTDPRKRTAITALKNINKKKSNTH